MILQPEKVDQSLLENGIQSARKKKDILRLQEIRLEKYDEGKCVQVLYTGPYDKEADTIRRMHSWIEMQNYRLSGKHHEIYISDARKTAPEKLKTILRQPVAK
jgi:hypothetical protein